MVGKFWIPAFAGMTKEGSGFARFPRLRQRDVAGPKGKVSRSHSHFETASMAGGGQIHRALIGRTFLNSFIMIYDGLRGQVTLAR